MRPTPASSGKTREDHAVEASSSASASSAFRRSPSSFKPCRFSSIAETPHEGTSCKLTASSSRSSRAGTGELTAAGGASSSKELREENERLKAELAARKKFPGQGGASSASTSALGGRTPTAKQAPRTSSRTRLEMEALQKKFADLQACQTSRRREINETVRAVQGLDLAFLFDATCSMDPYMEVTFTNVSTLQVQSMYYNMEKVLPGLWEKFNNNAGYVNKEGSYTDTLQAFSHWTHQRSKGILMVTDLQGVQVSSVGTGAFLLCDPAIHSKDVLRFTRTNLGEKGFDLFYKSHKCNTICKKLGLKPSV